MRAEEIKGLMEAYSKIHETPEVLNEEVVEEDLEQLMERGAPTDPKARAAYDAQVAKNRAALGNTLLFGNPQGRKPATLSTPTNVRGSRPTPSTSAAKPTQSKFAGARDAAFAKAAQIKGSPVVGPKPAAPVAAKPATPAAAKPAAAPAPKPAATKPAATAAPKPAATAAPKPAEAPKKTFNPLMQKTFGYQTGFAPDQVKGNAKKMAMMGSLKNISSGVDIFDLVKGHLLDEGYADSEEGAMVIMVNMSEEWRKSILESYGVELVDESALGTMAVLGGMAAGRAIHGKLQDRKAKKELEGKRRTSDYLTMKSRTKNVVARDRRASGDTRKEDLEAWVDELIAEGYDLSEYTWEEVAEIYAEELQLMELTGGKGHPGYKAGSKDHGDLEDHPAVKKGGVLTPRHGDHLGDLDDDDDEEDDLEAGLKDTARKKRENVRKPLRDKVKAARKKMTKEEMELDEAQRARENPEDHDKEEKKKYEPVRGEKTPMPPRGDKRREEFEKWYAKQMGR